MIVVLCAGFAGSLGAATLTDSGNDLTIDLATNEQITASTDGSTYTLVSNQTFVDGGVAAPGSDFSGFGTNTLTVTASGLTRYLNFRFADAGDGADLVFSAGSGSWQDRILVNLDGVGSRVANSGAVTSAELLLWGAETVEVAADITGTAVRFTGPVTLTASVSLYGSSNIRFESTVDGAFDLTLESPNAIEFQDGVGTSTPLTQLTAAVGGSTTLSSAVSTSGAQSYGNPVATAAGGTLLRASDLDFSGAVSGSGSLTIEPADADDAMAVGTAMTTGGLHLSDAELALFADGFSGITLGRSDATGRLTIDSADFLDSLTLVGGEVEVVGIVEVDGDLTVAGDWIVTATGLTPGSDHGQLRVLGAGRTVTLGSGSFSAEDFGVSAMLGDAITVIDLDDATSSVSGTFTDLAEGASVRLRPHRWDITYVGGDGNDVVLEVTSDRDYADAPDAAAGTSAGNYQTRLADGGPSHYVGEPIYLGASRDSEADGFDSATATGDDLDQGVPSDEDGLAIGAVDLDVTTGASHTVALHVTNETGTAATLSGWIDHDGNGVFDNATERAQAVVSDGTVNEPVTLTFPAAPAGSATNSTFARFRISTDAAAEDPTGAASDGEVEDHPIRIFEPSNGRVRSESPFRFNPGTETRFGTAIATVGDVDGDGISDIVVGKPGSGSGSSPIGKTSVLLMNADGSVKSGTEIDTGSTTSRFGAAVAPLGDFDGDGVPDVAVGEWGASAKKGRLVLVLLNADGTMKDMIFIDSPRSASDEFGSSVANLGDLDGNGIVDLAVGSPRIGADQGGVSILFLNPDGTILSETLLSTGANGAPSFASGIQFGSAVTALGDLDGDGVTEIAVGARYSGPGAVYILFLHRDGTIRAHLRHNSGSPGMPTLGAGDELGGSVAALGDLDGDGIGDLAVGLPGVSRGEVLLLFLQADGSIASRFTLGHNEGGVGQLNSSTRWGNSIAKWDDRDGNGHPELLIGAPLWPYSSDGGRVYLLELNAPVALDHPSLITWTTDEDVAAMQTLDASDSDGDTLTWSIPTAASNGLAELSGTGASRTVTYTPNADFHGTDSFQVTVSDGPSSDTVTVEVTVDPINDPPAVNPPGPLSVTEDVATALTGISFVDVDAGGGQMKATLSVATGMLTPTFGTGVVVGGTNTARTLQGTLAQLNSYFANGHLTYTTAQNNNADVTLAVLIEDLGNSGAGGNLSDSRNVTLTVDGVNDPPTITAPASLAFTEDVASAVTGISFADVDAGTGQVQATLTVATGSLAAATGTGVVVGGTSTARTLQGTISQLNDYFVNGHLTYKTAQDATADVTLTVLIDDLGNSGSGSNLTDTEDVTLTVDPVNDPPAIIAPASLSVTEDMATALTGISFDDPDSGSDSLIVTLSVPSGILTPTFGTGVSVGGSDTERNLTGTLSQLNSYFANGHLTYKTAQDATDDVTLTLVIDDLGNNGAGTNETDTQDVTLTVDPVNDAPMITAPAAITVVEDSKSGLPGISFADVDAGLGVVRVTLTTARGSLRALSNNGVTVGGNGAEMTLEGTVSDLNAFFGVPGVSFTPDDDDTADVTLGVVIDDLGNSGTGGHLTAGQNVTLTVTAVNDPPTIATPLIFDVTEDVASALSGISFADLDAGANTVQVVLTLVGHGSLGASSASGVVVGGSSSAMTLEGTLLDLNAFFAGGHVTFLTAPDEVGNAILGVAIDDLGNTGSGGNLTDSRIVSLTVTPVNDAPTITAPPALAVTEDVATALTGISFADPDAGTNQVQAILSVSSGTLELTPDPSVVVGGSDTEKALAIAGLVLEGTIDELNDYFISGRLTYTTDPDATADVTLNVFIDDLGNSGSGGSQTDTVDVALTVDAVNDPPTVTAPAMITVTEDTASGLLGIMFADVDGDHEMARATLEVPRGSLAAVSGHGVTVGGTAAQMTFDGTIADLNAFFGIPAVSYTTAQDDISDVTLDVSVQQLGGSGPALASGGTVTLTVTEVNDAPSFSITPSFAVDVDQGPQTVVDFAFDLSPGPAHESGQTLSFTVTDNTNPELFGAGPMLAADGTLTFTPAAGASGDATITVTLSDDGGVANGGVDTSAEQSFDIRVGEQDAPEVVAVSVITASGSPGGPLNECDQFQEPLEAFVVEFSEAMADPTSEEEPESVINPANYELWAAGANRDLEATACGTVTVGSDDVAIPISSVAWDGASKEATVSLAGPLSDGPYRLLVCATLEDEVGNSLADEVSLTFRQDVLNEFGNGQLDCTLDGWTQLSTLPAEIDHSSEDRDDASISGSARMQQLSSSTDFSLAQCLDVTVGDRLRLSGAVRVEDGAPDLTLERFCLGSPTPGCASPATPLDLASEAVAVTDGDWIYFTSQHSLADDAVSALCTVNVHTPSGGAVDVLLDGLVLQRGVFFDGFESGSTSAWSAAVQ